MTDKKERKLRGLVDRMIYRLLNDHNADGFTDEEIISVLDKAFEVIQPIPALVEMTAPLVIFGDIHGQFSDMRKFLNLVGHVPKTRMLFLGDYVDRCKHSVEVGFFYIFYESIILGHVAIALF
jgi:serine/threonine-protein phosphatase PP1 catalytic subunit